MMTAPYLNVMQVECFVIQREHLRVDTLGLPGMDLLTVHYTTLVMT